MPRRTLVHLHVRDGSRGPGERHRGVSGCDRQSGGVTSTGAHAPRAAHLAAPTQHRARRGAPDLLRRCRAPPRDMRIGLHRRPLVVDGPHRITQRDVLRRLEHLVQPVVDLAPHTSPPPQWNRHRPSHHRRLRARGHHPPPQRRPLARDGGRGRGGDVPAAARSRHRGAGEPWHRREACAGRRGRAHGLSVRRSPRTGYGAPSLDAGAHRGAGLGARCGPRDARGRVRRRGDGRGEGDDECRAGASPVDRVPRSGARGRELRGIARHARHARWWAIVVGAGDEARQRPRETSDDMRVSTELLHHVFEANAEVPLDVRWVLDTRTDPLAAAVRGVPLASGDALVTHMQRMARVDLQSGQVLEMIETPEPCWVAPTVGGPIAICVGRAATSGHAAREHPLALEPLALGPPTPAGFGAPVSTPGGAVATRGRCEEKESHAAICVRQPDGRWATVEADRPRRDGDRLVGRGRRVAHRVGGSGRSTLAPRASAARTRSLRGERGRSRSDLVARRSRREPRLARPDRR